jgi:copper transport protein
MARSWVRRFGGALTAEVVLVVAVLLVVGRLTSQPPARDVLADRAGQSALALDLGGRSAALALSPAATGPNHYVLTVDGDPLPDGTEALLRLTLTEQDIGQKEVRLDRAGGNRFEAHGSELSIVGDWTVQAIVRQIGEFQYAGSSPLAIAATPPAPDLPRPAWRFGPGAIVGLALVVLGMSGLTLAWFAGRTPLRKESAGLGTVALGFGVFLLLQARIEPASASTPAVSANPVPASSASISQGEQIYLANCLACHGAGGKGDGPSGRGLLPPPANFTIPHSRMHRDAEFFSWITGGIPGSPMPAFGEELSDEQIWDVINYIRVTYQGATPAGSPTP